MAKSEDTFTVRCKHKAVTAFFPYAVWMERDGEHKMMEAFFAAAKLFDSTTLWHPIVPFLPALFRAASPQAVVAASSNVPWHRGLNDASVVDMWAVAISADTCTEEVERRVVDALLQIASVDSLRPYITTDSWSWLNRRPTLPPICLGRSMGTKKQIVRRVKELGDVETLKSYLMLVWSEWNPISSPQSLAEMRYAISWDLRGVEKRVHREELVNHLDHVLKQLDLGLVYFRHYNPWIDEEGVQRAKGQYAKLKGYCMGWMRERRRIRPVSLPC
ncbi:hypothetical protein BJ322DRAFT_464834 [Thelephora terrestris]|uniref:Uncharacterized protein n=1 Tax=Thelephora terrestris TaxID=56493 RepID=A0A9P6H4U4_9AGAM|nr:hypothetical protein BJ322DRAFT_464834 [Thelephora terrestris]